MTLVSEEYTQHTYTRPKGGSYTTGGCETAQAPSCCSEKRAIQTYFWNLPFSVFGLRLCCVDSLRQPWRCVSQTSLPQRHSGQLPAATLGAHYHAHAELCI